MLCRLAAILDERLFLFDDILLHPSQRVGVVAHETPFVSDNAICCSPTIGKLTRMRP